ncbi:MAG: chromosomal replication initiation protein DnaA [Parcubacteria group bacterium]|nr:chromosomal replication initiation protein DnaA [Parcubacteria group bacterium]
MLGATTRPRRITLAEQLQKERRTSFENILEWVSCHCHISTQAILSETRIAPIARARHICMFLAYADTSMSTIKIARHLNLTDHTTVVHGIKRIRDLVLAHDDDVTSVLDLIRKEYSRRSIVRLLQTAVNTESAKLEPELYEIRNSRAIPFGKLLELVASEFQIQPAHIRSAIIRKEVLTPRQALMYLAYTDMSFPVEQIGSQLGGRERTTVLLAIAKIGRKINSDYGLLGSLNRIRMKYHEYYSPEPP